MYQVKQDVFLSDYERLVNERDEFVKTQSDLLTAVGTDTQVDCEILAILLDSVEAVAHKRYETQIAFYERYLCDVPDCNPSIELTQKNEIGGEINE